MFGVPFEAYVILWIGLAVCLVGAVVATFVQLIRGRGQENRKD
ncbi:MAG: hypothetical protein WCP95_16890 [Actinomycetes bacterium]